MKKSELSSSPVRFALERPRKQSEIRQSNSYGKKASGLLRLPPAWVPPFFVVSANLLDDCFIANERDIPKIVNQWLKGIQKLVRTTLPSVDRLILRSSGNRENISARGRYSSYETTPEQLGETLFDYVNEHLADSFIQGDSVSIIVQAYHAPVELGHLSNERRCYKELRDWLGERSSKRNSAEESESFQINIRNWREGKETVNAEQSLSCRMALNLIDILRSPARWATSAGIRLHYEWVWDGENVWIVQGDLDDSDQVGENPTNPTKRAASQNVGNLDVLSLISSARHSEYPKVENVLIYRELGLPPSNLWVLDDENIIEQLVDAKVSKKLRSDLKKLCHLPLIIRCDILSKDIARRQMLPRTDEKRNWNEALDWLIATAKKFKKEDLLSEKPVFLFHHFIPAASSAFVYAEPNRREVLVEALWGLPEGLYYNSHDKYIVDTGNSDLSKVIAANEDSMGVDVQPDFKPYFIVPNDAGKWVSKRLRQPFDWKPSIQPDDIVKDIAVCARKICERVGKSISVMWFVGIAEGGGFAGHMPWHHEAASLNTLRSARTGVRRKTVFDRDYVIKTEGDLNLVQNRVSAHNAKIARLKIRPEEDALLRDKKLLRKVGELAKILNVPILLEGGVLSHAYYQLTATGAAVEVAHPFNWRGLTHEFNKLVRDKIPSMISHFGEDVRVARITPETRIIALKHKLLEEVFELIDAESDEELLAELCDVQEVVFQIRSEAGIPAARLEQARKEKRLKRGGFENGVILLETKFPMGVQNDEDGVMNLVADREIQGALINKDRYLSLAQEVLSRVDQRVDQTRREVVRQAWIPVVALDWTGETKPLITRLNGDEVTGKVQLWREGNRLRIDLRIEVRDRDVEEPRLL